MRSVLECAVGNARRADGGVTSAVSEEGGAEALLFAGLHVDDSDGCDPVALCLDAEGVLREADCEGKEHAAHLHERLPSGSWTT